MTWVKDVFSRLRENRKVQNLDSKNRSLPNSTFSSLPTNTDLQTFQRERRRALHHLAVHHNEQNYFHLLITGFLKFYRIQQLGSGVGSRAQPTEPDSGQFTSMS